MTLSRSDLARLEAWMKVLKDKGEPFAMATVVRTLDATSAKPGGKALLDREGNLLAGWVGGGCARGAVGRAAREAIAEGAPQLISLRPQDLLDEAGLAAGETRGGIHFARNGCPSRGTMDIFVEPVLPLPVLTVCGAGPVAQALADMGARFDFDVRRHAEGGEGGATDGFQLAPAAFTVVATQGKGDSPALRAAVSVRSGHVFFVGSRRKFDTLAQRLRTQEPVLADRLDRVSAPAGLDIGAITPEEIALSILAQITCLRRAGAADP